MHFKSIGFKVFWIIFIFFLLPSALITFLSNRITTESMLKQKQQFDLQTIDCIISSLDQVDVSMRDAARMLSTAPDIQYNLSHLADNTASMTERYTRQSKMIAGMSLMDIEKRFIGETYLNRQRLSWFFNPSLLRKLTQNASMWTDPFTIENKLTGQIYRVQALIDPVYNQTGQQIGYIVLYFDTAYIQELIEKSGANIYVLDAAQCIVASLSGKAPYYCSLYDFTRIAYSLLINDSSAIVQAEDEKMIVTTRSYGTMKLQLVMISNFDSIRGALRSNYSKMVRVFSICCLFSLIAALLITRYFTRPISALKRVVGRATAGDLNVRCQQNSHDEFGQLGSAFNHFLDTIQQLMHQKVEEQRSKRKLQLLLLQQQIRPHFLYNVLEMIASLVQCAMTQEAVNATYALARFYRISLSGGSDIINIGQEIALIENYLTLQKLRYIEFMDYNIAIDPNILTYSIPKLTLQPLVENSIYHGLKTRPTKGYLSVSGALDNGRIFFEIYDSGNGMDESQLNKLRKILLSPTESRSDHFGLASVINRLNLFCGDVKIDIDSVLYSYTSVRISFPAIPIEDASKSNGDAKQ